MDLKNKNTLYLAVVLCLVAVISPTVSGREQPETKKLGAKRIIVKNNAEIKKIAKFAIQQYNNNQNELVKFVRVVKATEQVVSGKIYYLTLNAVDGEEMKTYVAKVWVKPTMNFKQLLEFKEFQGKAPADHADVMEVISPTASGREQPETKKLGGKRIIVKNNAEIKKIAKFAIQQYNNNQNELVKFVRVVKATEQVVSGKIYYLTLNAVDGEEMKTYVAKVWVKPTTNFKQLLEFKEFQGKAPADLHGDIMDGRGADGSAGDVVGKN